MISSRPCGWETCGRWTHVAQILAVLLVLEPCNAYSCGDMGRLTISNIGASGDDGYSLVLDLTAVVPSAADEAANCTAGLGLGDELTVFAPQVTGARLAITNAMTHEIIEPLIPSSGIPPFVANTNTTSGLASHDPLGLPSWSGFVAFGVSGLQPRPLMPGEAYSLVFGFDFPDAVSRDQFALAVEDALREGVGAAFPLNIASGSGGTSGIPFFGPPHGNRYLVPEPNSAVLFLFGCVGLACRGVRRRRRPV